MGLIVYLLALWGLTALYHAYLQPRNAKARRQITLMRHHIAERRKWDRDILTEKQSAELDALDAYLARVTGMLADLPAQEKRLAATPDDDALADQVHAARAHCDPARLQEIAKTSMVPADPPKRARKKAKGQADADGDADTGAMQKMRNKIAAKTSDKGGAFSPEAVLSEAKSVVEMLVVVIGVVAGLRGLFIQPFKIPTGSMQPTLYGIWFTPVDDPDAIPQSRFVRALHWVNYGRSYVDTVSATGGKLMPANVYPAAQGKLGRMLAPKSRTVVGGDEHVLPGSSGIPGYPGEVEKYLTRIHHGYQRRDAYDQSVNLAPGDSVARGYLTQGDHLFVDRVSYNFREPRRGDIVVFNTATLRDQDGTQEGRPLTGLFYIKRLVGLPGETIQVRDRQLWVKERDASEFRRIDGADDPAFERMYSMQGDYRGYTPLKRAMRDGSTRFADTFVIGDDEYLMMGDNSENSMDGRYFGPVPRQAIVGRACFVWWPFSRRWGLADHAEPEDYESDMDPYPTPVGSSR